MADGAKALVFAMVVGTMYWFSPMMGIGGLAALIILTER